jgi:hypothetical protein
MRCLESSFDVLGYADLLQWLKSAKKTGALRVCRDAAVRRIYFTDGAIIACSSNEPRLLLGQFLIANGWIDGIGLQECMKLQEGSGRSLGTLLVESGRISEIDLRKMLVARAEEIILGLFEWSLGNFRFEADHFPPKGATTLEMNVQTALLEGVRRQDAVNRIRSAFPSPNLVLHKTKRVPDLLAMTSYMERELYESIDGKRTLAEITLLCRSSEYFAGGFLLRLVESGNVQLGNVRAPNTSVVDDGTALNKLRQLVASEEYEDAVAWIESHDLTPDGDEFLAMLIAKAEAGFLAYAYRTQVPADAVPRRVRPDAPPGNDGGILSSEDIFLLDLIDGHWDVRSLGWIAPIRKIDIVRGLLRLRNQGCIELRPPASSPAPARHVRARGDEQGSGEDAAADIERAVGELGV